MLDSLLKKETAPMYHQWFSSLSGLTMANLLRSDHSQALQAAKAVKNKA